MGRVLVKDQYSAEHWVDESSLKYAPWRDCEVIRRDPEPEPEAEATSDAPAAQVGAGDKPAPEPVAAADDKRRPVGEPKAPVQPAKPAE